jgi:5-aminolevulinate synthase
MEALLHQSRSLCPFLKKTSPATLRSLSTTTAHYASPGGGRMSNLQMLARRCPVMGKALAVQSSRYGNSALRAYHAKVDRAKFHSAATKEAQAVDVGMIHHEPGK